MRATALILAAASLAIASGARAAGETPHHMTMPDGSLDMKSCAVCHKPDMSLERSELETCTLCHAEATHGGSIEHLRVPEAAVAAAMAARPKDAVALPLSKEGKITCTTCHLYHDPAVLGEAWLAQGWVPPDSGFPGEVREGITERWAVLEKAHGKTNAALFASKGARQLRLSVEDGALCKQCHGGLW